MLPVEAEILSLDLDAFRLLQGYRETGLTARAERASEAKAQHELELEKEQATAADAVEDDGPVIATEESSEPTPSKPAFEVEKSDPWLDRICELDDLEAERICELHGKLIAAGFLNFQIRNRITGIEYRVANAGKQYLTRKLEQASEIANDMAEASTGLSLVDED